MTCVCSIAALVFFFGENCLTCLDFQPSTLNVTAIAGIFSCHLLHWTGEHLLWDLGVFALLGAICEWRMPRRTYATCAAAAISIPIAVAFAHPELQTYRGLSGIDTALFALLVTSRLADARSSNDKHTAALFSGLLILLWAKVGIEWFGSGALFVNTDGFLPLPVAHVVGGMIGMLIGISTHDPHAHAAELHPTQRSSLAIGTAYFGTKDKSRPASFGTDGPAKLHERPLTDEREATALQ